MLQSFCRVVAVWSCLILSVAARADQQPNAGMLRYPDVGKDSIVFVYAMSLRVGTVTSGSMGPTLRGTSVKNGDVVVTEFHIGSAALLERLSVLAIRLSPHGASRRSWRRGYRVRWDQLDLSDPRHPRLLCPVGELAVLDANDPDDDEVAVPADTPDAGDPIGGE